MKQYNHNDICEAIRQYREDRKVWDFVENMRIVAYLFAIIIAGLIATLCPFEGIMRIICIYLIVTPIWLYPMYSSMVGSIARKMNKMFDGAVLAVLKIFGKHPCGSRDADGNTLYGDYYVTLKYEPVAVHREGKEGYVTMNAGIAFPEYNYFVKAFIGNGWKTVGISHEMHEHFKYAKDSGMVLVIHKDDYCAETIKGMETYPAM